MNRLRCIAVAFASCSDDDDNTPAIKFSPSTVSVAVGGTQSVMVAGGDGTYTAKSSDLFFFRAFEQLDTIFGITIQKKQKRNAGCDFDDSSSLQTIYKEKPLNFNIIVGMRYTLGR